MFADCLRRIQPPSSGPVEQDWIQTFDSTHYSFLSGYTSAVTDDLLGEEVNRAANPIAIGSDGVYFAGYYRPSPITGNVIHITPVNANIYRFEVNSTVGLSDGNLAVVISPPNSRQGPARIGNITPTTFDMACNAGMADVSGQFQVELRQNFIEKRSLIDGSIIWTAYGSLSSTP